MQDILQEPNTLLPSSAQIPCYCFPLSSLGTRIALGEFKCGQSEKLPAPRKFAASTSVRRGFRGERSFTLPDHGLRPGNITAYRWRH